MANEIKVTIFALVQAGPYFGMTTNIKTPTGFSLATLTLLNRILSAVPFEW